MVCGARSNGMHYLVDYQVDPNVDSKEVVLGGDFYDKTAFYRILVDLESFNTIEVKSYGEYSEVTGNNEFITRREHQNTLMASHFGVFCIVSNGYIDNRDIYVRLSSLDLSNDYNRFSLRPVRRLIDGAIGMYDTVSRRFLSNEGTGAFIPGPETGKYY